MNIVGNLALFRNDKGDNQARPDYRGVGKVAVDGAEMEMRLAGWIKTDRRGEKYISLKLEPDNRQQQAAPQQDAAHLPTAGATGHPARGQSPATSAPATPTPSVSQAEDILPDDIPF